MSNDKKTLDGERTLSTKGHQGGLGKVQGGYQGPTGTLGKPPTEGSGVKKPAEPKKD